MKIKIYLKPPASKLWECTLPKTNSSPLKNHAWKTILSFLGPGLFTLLSQTTRIFRSKKSGSLVAGKSFRLAYESSSAKMKASKPGEFAAAFWAENDEEKYVHPYISNLNIGNGCFTKHPLYQYNGCFMLFQVPGSGFLQKRTTISRSILDTWNMMKGLSLGLAQWHLHSLFFLGHPTFCDEHVMTIIYIYLF